MNPIWLAAAAGMIVPVVIHLWNIRQGKVLRIGSTLLLSGAIQKSSSSLKISQWLLLALRCLLILILAALLAGPQWKTDDPGAGKGWILMNRNEISNVHPVYKNAIDSLLKAGFEIHDFSTEFPVISLSDSLSSLSQQADQKDPENSRIRITENTSPWQLIRRLDRKLPAGFPVYVFSKPLPVSEIMIPTAMGATKRPVISLDLHWQFVSADASTAVQPLYKKQQPDGTLRTLTMHSNEMASWFTSTINTDATNKLPADTGTLRISIVYDSNNEDAKYMEAAIRAVASFSHRKLVLVATQNTDAIVGRQDWIFWLSEKNVPESVTALTENIVQYASGNNPPVNTNARFTTGDGPIETEVIRIYKSFSVAPGATDSLVWQDDRGNMILGKKRYPSNSWQLFMRLDPSWSNLSWNPEFPKMIAGLVLNNELASIKQPSGSDPETQQVLSTINNFDKRIVPVEEATPALVLQSYKEQRTPVNSMDLEKLCWLILFLLFASERIVSHQQKQILSA